jgi:RNA recognition motif-containing protein
MGNIHFNPQMFHCFFNLASKVKKFAMHPNQVLKICNVAYLLLKSVLFYGNNPHATHEDFLEQFFPKYPLKQTTLKKN